MSRCAFRDHWEQAPQLQAARGDDRRVLSIVQDEIEQAWDEAHLCETDKAWDAIHRCLGDGPLGCAGEPLAMCNLFGEQMHQDDSYIVSLLTPFDVKRVADALRPIDCEWMRAAYFKIDPADYGLALNEEDFLYTWDYFEVSARSTKSRYRVPLVSFCRGPIAAG